MVVTKRRMQGLDLRNRNHPQGSEMPRGPKRQQVPFVELQRIYIRQVLFIYVLGPSGLSDRHDDRTNQQLQAQKPRNKATTIERESDRTTEVEKARHDDETSVQKDTTNHGSKAGKKFRDICRDRERATREPKSVKEAEGNA